MNEGSKQIFWLDDTQLRQFGWSASVGECNSNQRTFAGQAFTIMFWYKQSTFSNGHNGIITIRKGTQGNTNGFSIGVEPSGEFTGCQQNVAIISTGHTISANEWHHLAWTRDATGTSIKAYIDGELVHSGTYRAQPGFADTIVFPCVVNNAGSCAKLQINGIEFFANVTDPISQKVAIRYVNVWQYNSTKLLASFWPDKRGGFVDTISKKFYAPIQGEVKIKKWKEV